MVRNVASRAGGAGGGGFPKPPWQREDGARTDRSSMPVACSLSSNVASTCSTAPSSNEVNWDPSASSPSGEDDPGHQQYHATDDAPFIYGATKEVSEPDLLVGAPARSRGPERQLEPSPTQHRQDPTHRCLVELIPVPRVEDLQASDIHTAAAELQEAIHNIVDGANESSSSTTVLGSSSSSTSTSGPASSSSGRSSGTLRAWLETKFWRRGSLRDVHRLYPVCLEEGREGVANLISGSAKILLAKIPKQVTTSEKRSILKPNTTEWLESQLKDYSDLREAGEYAEGFNRLLKQKGVRENLKLGSCTPQIRFVDPRLYVMRTVVAERSLPLFSSKNCGCGGSEDATGCHSCLVLVEEHIGGDSWEGPSEGVQSDEHETCSGATTRASTSSTPYAKYNDVAGNPFAPAIRCGGGGEVPARARAQSAAAAPGGAAATATRTTSFSSLSSWSPVAHKDKNKSHDQFIPFAFVPRSSKGPPTGGGKGNEQAEEATTPGGTTTGSSTSPQQQFRVDLANAFSHYTYETSGGLEAVTDLQGTAQYQLYTSNDESCRSEGLRITHVYTDPQVIKPLLCEEVSFGKKDKLLWFRDGAHKCNPLCRALGLRPLSSLAAKEKTPPGLASPARWNRQGREQVDQMKDQLTFCSFSPTARHGGSEIRPRSCSTHDHNVIGWPPAPQYSGYNFPPSGAVTTFPGYSSSSSPRAGLHNHSSRLRQQWAAYSGCSPDPYGASCESGGQQGFYYSLEDEDFSPSSCSRAGAAWGRSSRVARPPRDQWWHYDDSHSFHHNFHHHNWEWGRGGAEVNRRSRRGS